MRFSNAKGKRQIKTPEGAPKEGFFVIFWFFLSHQTNTAESGQKMAKTKVVRKSAYMRLSEGKS